MLAGTAEETDVGPWDGHEQPCQADRWPIDFLDGSLNYFNKAGDPDERVYVRAVRETITGSGTRDVRATG